MLNESPSMLCRCTVITLLDGHQGFEAGCLRETLVAVALVDEVCICTAPASEKGNWDSFHTTSSSHFSETRHLYLPTRRCCFCWLFLLSLSRVCPELTLQFCLASLVPQSKLDSLESSSAVWNGARSKLHPEILIQQISVSYLLFIIIVSIFCFSYLKYSLHELQLHLQQE